MTVPRQNVREEQIAIIAAKWWRNRAAGQGVPDDIVTAAFPHLMPELAERMRLLRRIGQAQELGEAPAGHATSLVGSSHNHAGSSFLNVDLGTSRRVELAMGTWFDERFLIGHRIGQGGMGTVYLAEDRVLNKRVAVKTFDKDVVTQFREQVVAETALAQRVTHINVCRIHDIKLGHEPAYLTMEYIDGEDLDQTLLRIGRFVPERALQVACEICQGLSAAHEQGVIHRDIKPRNIMLDSSGIVRITDFGLARISYGIEPSSIAGTLNYMAPEQQQGHGTSELSDIYALGLVLHEIYTGQLPAGWGPASSDLATSGWIPPSRLVPELDSRVERTILRCLQTDPTARPQSVRAIMGELAGTDRLTLSLSDYSLRSTAPLRWMTIAALVGLVLCWLTSPFRPLEQTDFELASPRRYQERATALIAEFGHQLAGQRDHQASGFVYSFPYRNEPREANQSLGYWYRQAAGPLTPTVMSLNRNQPPTRVHTQDPPWTEPAMLGLELNTQGHLREYRHVPAAQGMGRAPANLERELEQLFSAANLKYQAFERQSFEPAPGLWLAGVFGALGTDLLFRVVGDSDHPTVVLVGIKEQRVTHFRVTNRTNETSFSNPFADNLNDVLFLVVSMGGMLWVVLSKRNSSSREGDAHAAKVTAAIVFSSLAASTVLSESHTLDLHQEIGLIQLGLLNALFWSALLWLLYVSLAPMVRRELPRSIDGWRRVTHGQFRHPQVALWTICGAMLGTLAPPILMTAHALVRHGLGLPMRYGIPPIESPAIESMFGLASVYCSSLANSIYFAFALVLFPMLLMKIIDNFRVAVCLAWGINSIFYGAYYGAGVEPWWDWSLFCGYMSLWAALHLAVALRGGVLAAAVHLWVSSIIFYTPFTLSENWYREQAVIGTACLAIFMTCYVVWVSQALHFRRDFTQA